MGAMIVEAFGGLGPRRGSELANQKKRLRTKIRSRLELMFSIYGNGLEELKLA